jgi:DNA topoisomerase IB
VQLALRAGNEKDEDQADTVGCCSLRVEHITLHDERNGKECVVAFDFLGKDSIRYYNEVPVEKRVYKNLKLFMENKAPGDDLFDRLNVSYLKYWRILVYSWNSRQGSLEIVSIFSHPIFFRLIILFILADLF